MTMIVEHPVNDTADRQLPPLSLQSMTPGQLEDFIPQLVTQVTGRSSPLFGRVQYRPDWWPLTVEWITPQELAHHYQNPTEKLREIIKSCYHHLEQDNLLNSANLPSFTKSLHLSPTAADFVMCAAEPTTEQSNSMETEETMCPSDTTTEHQENVEKCTTDGNSIADDCDSIMIVDDDDDEISSLQANSNASKTGVKKDNKIKASASSEIEERGENKNSSVKITDESNDTELPDLPCTYKIDKEEDTDSVVVINDSQEDAQKQERDDQYTDKNGKTCDKKITRNSEDYTDIDTEQLLDLMRHCQENSENSLKCDKEENEGCKDDMDCSLEIIENENDFAEDLKQSADIAEDIKVPELSNSTNGNKKLKEKETDNSKPANCSDKVNSEISTEMVSDEVLSEIDLEIIKSLQMRFNDGPMKSVLKKTAQTLKRRNSNDKKLDVTKDTKKTVCSKNPTSERLKHDPSAKNEDTNKKASASLEKPVKKPQTLQKTEKQEDDVVWICFLCAKGFANQNELMSHQEVCEEDTDTDDITPLKSCDPTPLETSSGRDMFPLHPLSELAVREHLFQTKTSQSKGSYGSDTTTPSQPVPALLRKVGSGIKTLPLGLPTKSRIAKRRRKRFKDIYIPPSRDVYFESLGLGLTPKVEEISKSPRKSVSEDDCQIIDLTLEDSQASHPAPMTPRTRFMMTQLSRDDSRRRHLSFSSSQSSSTVIENKTKANKKASSDSESSDESSEEEAVVQRKNAPFKSILLGIPLTSPLGQRLKKHWQNENKVPVISNVEQFCKTSHLDDLIPAKGDKKNPIMEKLRHRPPPQVTFRFTKKYINKWFHSYKFDKSDMREFNKRIKTGLERESRIRKKQMKQCKVVLRRVSKKDIKYWTTPRVKKGPRFLPNLQQIKYNYMNPTRMILRQQSPYVRNFIPQSQNRPLLLMSQPRGNSFVRAAVPRNIAMSQGYYPRQQILSPVGMGSTNMGPTPQLLVRTLPGGNEGMRLEIVPIPNRPLMQQHPNQNMVTKHTHMTNLLQRQVPRSQKRKQVFQNVRADDNMVICLSSDEEDVPVSKQVQSTKVYEKRKIGPASFMRNQKARRLSQTQTTPSIYHATTKEQTFKTQSVGSDSASSRVFGKSFNSVGSAPRWQSAAPSTFQSNPSYTSVTNGKIMFASSAQDTGPVIASNSLNSVPSVTICHKLETKKEALTIDTNSQLVSAQGTQPESPNKSRQRSQSQSDSEYMDYEIICIDSDDEELAVA